MFISQYRNLLKCLIILQLFLSETTIFHTHKTYPVTYTFIYTYEG